MDEIRKMSVDQLVTDGIAAYEHRDFEKAKLCLLCATDRDKTQWRGKLYLAMTYLYSGDVLLAANLLRFLKSNCPEAETCSKASAVLGALIESKSRSIHEISHIDLSHKPAGDPTPSTSFAHNKRIQRLVNTSNGQHFHLDERRTTIGRDTSNQISLSNDNFVSQFQAAITRENSEYFVEDMITINATRINGKSISGKTKINPGDVIKIGKTLLRVE